MQTIPRFVLSSLLSLICVYTFAQTGGDNKTNKVEDLRRLKEQLQQEQRMLQQQQEWNDQTRDKEIKKLSQENQQKSMEVATSKQEAQKARLELAQKKIELQETTMKIDSARALLDSTVAQLQTSEITLRRATEALVHQEDSIKLQALQIENGKIEIEAQKQKSRLSIIAAALAIVLFLVLAALFIIRQRSMKVLAEKNKIIAEEKKRSDELLLNILPEEVMNELKARGKTQARNYHKATVLFADIKDFTTISEELSPDELVEALDAYFERFDRVIEKYNIEKIKTIGDAYVCAGGIPTKDEDNPQLVVQAAVDFVKEINALKAQREKEGKKAFDFRIGIHTGHLVAGVIGIRKFAYDIWGDTVNMAARMQQAGEPNKVNISGATYEMVKNRFSCVYRGKHEAKNKGEIDMYFVEKAIHLN